MEEKIISIDLKPELSDFFRPLLWLFFKRFWALIVILFLASLFSLKELLYGKPNSGKILNFLPLIILLALFLSLFFTARRFATSIKGNVRFTFTDDEVEISTLDSMSQIKWSFFEKVNETRKEFLLFQNKTRFHSIPKRSFQNDTQIQQFRELIRRKLGDNAKLK